MTEAPALTPDAVLMPDDAVIVADLGGSLVRPELTSSERQRVADDVASAVAPRTLDAYNRHWRGFAEWCDGRGFEAMPADPEIVAAYLATRADAGLSVSTVTLDLVAISKRHETRGHTSPREHAGLRMAWKGIKRRIGAERGRTPNRKAPLVAADITMMVSTEPSTTAGTRNRALLALGFAGAFRRSELVALEVSDVEVVPARGLRVTVRTSKTDQAGEGHVKAIPFGEGEACPVRAVRAWLGVLEEAGATDGPLFRSVTRWGAIGAEPLTGRSVARIIKAAAERVGLDPARFSGHSVRAGYVTHALDAGVDALAITRTTGHRGLSMIPVYDRRRDVWTPSGL